MALFSPRRAARLAALILLLYPLDPAVGQTSFSAATAGNPILAQLVRVDPAMVPIVLQKLEPLKTGTLRTGSRGGATSAEQAQIAANPDFGQAYAKHPDETLAILRQTNQYLRNAGRQ